MFHYLSCENDLNSIKYILANEYANMFAYIYIYIYIYISILEQKSQERA